MPEWDTIEPSVLQCLRWSLALLTAVALGGLIGLERELKGHWAGLRTHIMVAAGAAVFVLAGVEASRSAPSELTRVIQGVATGVGFIGAGTVVKLTDRMQVRGLTTAATIWIAAAVGTAVGVGLFFLPIFTTLVSVAVLRGLRSTERWLEGREKKNRDQHIVPPPDDIDEVE